MTDEKRTIDPRYYCVNGYGNVPAYNLPSTATGHIIEFPKGKPLCGAPRGYLKEREVKERGGRIIKWERICKLCQRVVEKEGLVEWTLPKMGKGYCPVLTERTGELTKHIIIPERPRCKSCPTPEWNRFERCAGHHETYGLCNSCGYEDRSKHYCDFVVGRAAGISTDFGYCNKGAKAEYQFDQHDLGNGAKDMRWGFLCGLHTPAARQKRKDDWQAKYDADRAATRAQHAKENDKSDGWELLVEVSRWVAKNRDLAAEDEWLGQIAERMAGNETLQAALEKS